MWPGGRRGHGLAWGKEPRNSGFVEGLGLRIQGLGFKVLGSRANGSTGLYRRHVGFYRCRGLGFRTKGYVGLYWVV